MNIKKIDELRQELAIYIDANYVDNLSDPDIVRFSLETERVLAAEMHVS